jgi:hypothetical protein
MRLGIWKKPVAVEHSALIFATRTPETATEILNKCPLSARMVAALMVISSCSTETRKDIAGLASFNPLYWAAATVILPLDALHDATRSAKAEAPQPSESGEEPHDNQSTSAVSVESIQPSESSVWLKCSGLGAMHFTDPAGVETDRFPKTGENSSDQFYKFDEATGRVFEWDSKEQVLKNEKPWTVTIGQLHTLNLSRSRYWDITINRTSRDYSYLNGATFPNGNSFLSTFHGSCQVGVAPTVQQRNF